VIGLGGRKVGFEPDLVTGLQVGYFGDGKGGISASDADVDLGADEVETCSVVGEKGRDEGQARTFGNRI